MKRKVVMTTLRNPKRKTRADRPVASALPNKAAQATFKQMSR